jgi:hypothetical protein
MASRAGHTFDFSAIVFPPKEKPAGCNGLKKAVRALRPRSPAGFPYYGSDYST